MLDPKEEIENVAICGGKTELDTIRARLLNKNFTLIANNCIGGVIYKDLGLQFLSPTINLFFYACDYIKFLSKMDYYLSTELEVKLGNKSYPVGILDDIEIHFLHYISYQEAKLKWEERKKRINKDNLFIIGSDKDQCSPEIIEAFDSLSYKNKIFLSSQNYPSLHSVIWLKEYVNCKEIPNIIPNREWLKYIDIVAWLNKEHNFRREK